MHCLRFALAVLGAPYRVLEPEQNSRLDITARSNAQMTTSTTTTPITRVDLVSRTLLLDVNINTEARLDKDYAVDRGPGYSEVRGEILDGPQTLSHRHGKLHCSNLRGV
jgi:hypothetical protein